MGWQYSEVVSTTHHLVHGGTLFYSSPHLYRFASPRGLALGEHTVTITATDRYGVVSTATFNFTVRPTPETPTEPETPPTPPEEQPVPDPTPEVQSMRAF